MSDLGMEITPELLHCILRYNEFTGELFWRSRDASFFENSKRGKHTSAHVWNSKFSGEKVGHIARSGYIQICLFDRLYYAHRVIWMMKTGEWPRGDIDHINGNRSDNSWKNLREATRSQNSMNSRLGRNNKFGLKGVSLDRRNKSKPYTATITANKKQFRLGNYATPEEAHKAYADAAEKLHGEFKRIA